MKSEELLLTPVPLAADGRSEAWLRDFLMRHPRSLPCRDIDPAFADPVPVCTELRTAAGSIDGVLVTPTGRLVILECKLWRNPQARREVVGQILDYAKELARWNYSTLQAAVASRMGKRDNLLFDLVAAQHPGLDEARFVDAVERTLATGRFLLMIAGDGIQSSARAIAEYLQEHATLRFALAMVEVRGYALPDGRLLVQPRILARTELIERTVIVPVFSSPPTDLLGQVDKERDAPLDTVVPVDADDDFWATLFSRLQFDDPGQAIPRLIRPGNARASLFVPDLWVTLYRHRSPPWNEMGACVRCRGAVGRRVYDALQADAAELKAEFANRMPDAHLTSNWWESKDSGEIAVALKKAFTAKAESEHLDWLCRAAAALVDALRPRIRAILDAQAEEIGATASA